MCSKIMAHGKQGTILPKDSRRGECQKQRPFREQEGSDSSKRDRHRPGVGRANRGRLADYLL